jgi:homoserine O-succinyltransferase
MPIRIPSKLPAFEILKSEGVNVMSNADADRQDIRPLKIGLLNLMPLKFKQKINFQGL